MEGRERKWRRRGRNKPKEKKHQIRNENWIETRRITNEQMAQGQYNTASLAKQQQQH